MIVKKKFIAGSLVALLAIAVCPLQAGILYVPNASFESPGGPSESPYAWPLLDEWQKSPGADFLIGSFTNVPFPGQFIDNCDGKNAVFLFADPGVALFQDYNTIFSTNTTPDHAFNAKFNVGHSYRLTVGVIGGGGGMSNGVTMQIGLYYRDASNNMVAVAATAITNTTDTFPTNTHFVDFDALLPNVNPGDPCAGQNIGVQLISTVTNAAGGYWDLDNVRLVEQIVVPNFSFESPGGPSESPYAWPLLDEWQKSPGADFLIGSFTNVPFPGQFIDNCDGTSAVFLFADPGVALFQDYNTIFGTNTTPDHAFNAAYRPGYAYQLTVGAIGGAGGMTNGVTMEISLYYRDASSNMITLAATTITNTTDTFPTNTHFVDFSALLPVVNPGNAFAGKNIGIQLLSTANPGNTGGYWDLDNVRLVETVATALASPARTNGAFQFNLVSEPGLSFDVLAAASITTPSSNWMVLGTVTNVSGTTSVTDTNTAFTQRFYQARKL